MITVSLISFTPQPEKTVAAAAKLCYSPSDVHTLMQDLTDEKADRFIASLLEMGHESPLEHVSFTFGIEGVSRTFLAQMTRHRIASYSVQSQRYVEKSDFSYITPPAIAQCPQAVQEYERCMRLCAESYQTLTQLLTPVREAALLADGEDASAAARKAKKLAMEDARFVLPGACDTRMVVTMNTRSLYNFFRHRCCSRAQWEIRQVATQMLHLVSAVAPALFAKAGPPCLTGPCPEGKMTCGKAADVRAFFQTLHEEARADKTQQIQIKEERPWES